MANKKLPQFKVPSPKKKYPVIPHALTIKRISYESLQFLEIVGCGTFASVTKCRDIKCGDIVALKKLHHADNDEQKLLFKEALLLQDLKRVKDSCERLNVSLMLIG